MVCDCRECVNPVFASFTRKSACVTCTPSLPIVTRPLLIVTLSAFIVPDAMFCAFKLMIFVLLAL
ncbi:hypothetical protein N2V80_29545, partial [Bacillus sp. FSL W8-0640]|uniref:hypothetical protein n=1 Tax=Bacillus sp. FSL W8-0640 TaxID=2978210 RepID=UPI0030F86146